MSAECKAKGQQIKRVRQRDEETKLPCVLRQAKVFLCLHHLLVRIKYTSSVEFEKKTSFNSLKV